ncbi:MAG: aminotransferase class I/II-fold pyridoxal phosphate-dependent enzyme [Candidatus Margulisbacteria bacterium]|jgi:histidinol-phosphate/aromatic aminotransferase/cobyric acid decarboxylase-like protein/2-C-methyl-D-erythritol 4-phosphate cytidylyltransferase|nr:aminotransferase class I/II-fold pyridoxal phosphate-dependent enzyme [Candidatus Margulisiibacteriota bacterium]
MQAVILAAGMGKRLGDLTQNSTKCMVPFNGRRLVEYTLDAIVAAGSVERVIIVVGHGADEVKKFLGKDYKGLTIEYVLNPVYDTTNNIYSLFLAKKYLESDDTILLESDLIFDPSIIGDLIREKSANVAVVAKHEPWMDGTVALLDETGHVANYIAKKEFNWAQAGKYYKTVNIYKFSREFCKNKFVPFLAAYISSNGKNSYYEEVFKLLTFIDPDGLKALPVGDKLWYEIDDLQDLDIASVLFAKESDRVVLMQKRYGGYWRFPKLKDFCYLVNPYFPPARLIAELKENFPVLLTQYPSGLNIQDLLAAKLFGCDANQILVGNGAAELIKGLIPDLRGNIGVPFPTFNEYHETIRNGKLVEFQPQNDDFSYTAQELSSFCTRQNIAALVLINPDNPSGHSLPKEDVLWLAKELGKAGKLLILDESFVDFVDGSLQNSLIDHAILRQNRNLVVVKSISKSYGVPGLRLGVMATANTELLTATRDTLSIWNINSFGEYFLQIIGKYAADYTIACAALVKERERLYNGLKKIDYLRPLRSYANYIFCEVKGSLSSAELTARLLNRDSLFIKDCRGKKGIGERSFVRFAVRDEKDNDQLLAALGRMK